MKRRPPGSKTSSMPISKAIVGFVNHKFAEGLTDRSVSSYERLLTKWIQHAGDKRLDQVTSDDIRSYLTWLRRDYQPIRFNRQTHPLSPKTIRNIWVTLASFYRWASMEFKIPNPMEDVQAPKYQPAPVKTFTKSEVEKILKACKYTKEANTIVRHSYTFQRPTANRDRAIVLTLLDTGLRAMELCMLKIEDVDLKKGKVEVKHGVQGGGKGGKGRSVFVGKTARRTIWRYLACREDYDDSQAPLFLGRGDRFLTPNGLRQLIKSLAEKAGVNDAYPHKFRHTFAITYLRSGGDIFTLQALLGHKSLDIVRHYARVAEVDVEHAHRKASPADNWRL